MCFDTTKPPSNIMCMTTCTCTRYGDSGVEHRVYYALVHACTLKHPTQAESLIVEAANPWMETFCILYVVVVCHHVSGCVSYAMHKYTQVPRAPPSMSRGRDLLSVVIWGTFGHTHTHTCLLHTGLASEQERMCVPHPWAQWIGWVTCA